MLLWENIEKKGRTWFLHLNKPKFHLSFVSTGVGEEIHHLEGKPERIPLTSQILPEQTARSTSLVLIASLPRLQRANQRDAQAVFSKYHWIICNDFSSCIFFLHLLKRGHRRSSILASPTAVPVKDARMGCFKTKARCFFLKTTEVWDERRPSTKIGHFVHSRL